MGEKATVAAIVLSENSAATPAQAMVRDVADRVIGLLGGDLPRAESSKWWREDEMGSSGAELAGTRTDLPASLVLTSVIAGCVYFSPVGERARTNGRRNGAHRHRWI